MAACLLVLGAGGSAQAQEPAGGSTDSGRVAPATSEEVEPRIIGTTGTMLMGVSGYLDRFSAPDDALPVNYTLQLDVGRFVSRRIVVRGGLAGSGVFGGAEDEERATGVGAAALHVFGGASWYFTPQSLASLYAGAEYWSQITSRESGDRGVIVGRLGIQGALSSRASAFMEGGYGVGLTRDEEGETRTRMLLQVGVRVKL